MFALHRDEVIVDLGAVFRVGERPAEAHRAIDPGRIHRRQQLVRGDDRAPAAMTRVEPRIERRQVIPGIAHARRQDVDVAVDDHPSQRP